MGEEAYKDELEPFVYVIYRWDSDEPWRVARMFQNELAWVSGQFLGDGRGNILTFASFEEAEEELKYTDS